MRQRVSRQSRRRKTGGVFLAATAMVSTVLVSAGVGVSGADPVSTTVPLVCSGADAATMEVLGLAKGLIGMDTIPVDLIATAADIPANAGIDQEINAQFAWAGTMSQVLIDKAAPLGIKLNVSKIKSSMAVRGPSSVDAFQANGTDKSITPVVGQAASIDMGTLGGPIKTTSGGIITYRVSGVTLTAALDLSGKAFVLNLTCAPTGSNLIAKTTVKDPDAPNFVPEVVKLNAAAGGTATVDLLNNVIQPGKTPLIKDSLKIVESPSAGTAEIKDGVFTFTAPNAAGTYSTTVEICGEPKAESGMPGVDEVQKLQLGDNWTDGPIGPRPVGFTLKQGDQKTGIIWTARHSLGDLFFPLPLNGVTPTAENWAPDNGPGLVNDYVLGIELKQPSADDVKSALEKLPTIGTGNVEVTALKESEKNPDAVTGFSLKFVNKLAQQDVPPITLGDWFSVPPQEVLDRIGEAVAGIAGGAKPDPNAPINPVVAHADAARDAATAAALADGKTEEQATAAGAEARWRAADDYIGAKIMSGQEVTEEEWKGWATVRILDPLMDSVPQIIAWINSLFPKKVVLSTLVGGEAPTPPQALCAQGIIDVTVAGPAVEAATDTNNPVAGKGDERGISFTG